MAARAILELVATFDDKVSRGLGGVGDKLGALAGSVGTLGKSFGALATGDISGAADALAALPGPVGLVAGSVGGLVSAFDKLSSAAAAEKLENNQLASALKRSTSDWDGSTAALDAFISKGEDLAFQDSAVRQSLEKLAAATNSVTDAQADVALAMDFARAKHISLETATTAIAKAEMGQTAALKKYGIEVTKEMSIENALSLVRQDVAGAAQQYASSSEGAAIRSAAAFQNAAEQIGGALLPLREQVMGGLASFITGPTFQGAIDTATNILGTQLPKALDFLQTTFGPVMTVVQDFGSVLADAFGSGSARLDLLQKLPDWLQPIGKILGDVAGNWGEFFSALSSGGDILTSFGELLKNNVIDTLANIGIPAGVVSGVQSALDTIGEAVAAAAEGFQKNGLVGALDALAQKFPVIQGPIDTFKAALATIGDVLATATAGFQQDGLGGAIDALAAKFPLIQQPIELFKDALSGIQDVLTTVAAGFQQGGLSGAIDALAGKFPALQGPLDLVKGTLTTLADAGAKLTAAFSMGGLAGVWETLSSSATSANPILSTISNVIAAMTPIVQAAQGVWAVIVGKFQEFATQIGPQFQQFWTNLQPALQQLQPIFDSLMQVLGTVGQVVGAVLGGVLVTAFSAAMGVIEGFINFLPSLGTIFSGVFEVIRGVLDTLGSLVGGVINTVGALLRGDWQGAWDAAVATVEGMANGIGEIISGLWTTIQGVFQGGIDFITGFVDGFSDTISGIFKALSDTLVGHSIIPDMIDAIKGVIDTGLKFITGLWDNAWKTVSDTVTKVWNDITTWVGQQIDAVKTRIDLGVAAVKLLWGQAWDNISSKVTEVWNSITTWVGQQIDAVKTKIDAVSTAITTAWGTFWDGIGTTLSTAWDTIVTTVTDQIGNIKSYLEKVPGQILSTVTGIGSGIIDGILQGIKDSWNKITGAIASLAQDLPQPIKDALGIHSPSDVMADEIGAPAIQGVLQGAQAAAPALYAGFVTIMQGLNTQLAAFFNPDTEGSFTNLWREGLFWVNRFMRDVWLLDEAMKRNLGWVTQEVRTAVAEMGVAFAEGLGGWTAVLDAAAQSLGAAISSGMSAGIEAGKSGVISAAVGVATAALDAAKAALGIASPSRKFYELGQQSASGFSNALLDGRGQVAASMQRLVDTSAMRVPALVPVAAMSTVAPGGGRAGGLDYPAVLHPTLPGPSSRAERQGSSSSVSHVQHTTIQLGPGSIVVNAPNAQEAADEVMQRLAKLEKYNRRNKSVDALVSVGVPL